MKDLPPNIMGRGGGDVVHLKPPMVVSVMCRQSWDKLQGGCSRQVPTAFQAVSRVMGVPLELELDGVTSGFSMLHDLADGVESV